MIISIDHIAFCTTKLEEARMAFEALGYHQQFREVGLRDLDNKKDLMRRFSGTLEMALMNRAGSISVELLDHGHAFAGDSYILPVLEAFPFDVEKRGDSHAAGNAVFVRAGSQILNADFFVPKVTGTAGFQCSQVIAESDNIEESSKFWRRLGFKTVSAGDLAAHLEFRAPLSRDSWHLLLRQRQTPASASFLDTRGFNCIALISTDAEKDRVKFEGMGMNPTESNPFRVNGKDLNIFWLRGPCGEIVEIIGLK